ncbi:MAG: DUF2807 domain-containing protein [Candidatus Azobacteroides sp.]|nr:DUF2807 domain-containing protein [Candidatus Azobacteroides sp.]
MKTFTPAFILCFILFPFAFSCIGNPAKEIKGNYTLVNEKINVGDYEEIVLKVPANVIYRQISQSEPFLQILVDQNIFSSLDISVQKGQLIIAQKNDSSLNPSQFTIYANSKNLNKLNIEGSGNVFLENEVNARNMEILISGTGDLKADSLFCENLSIQINGSGDAEIKGAATHAAFNINGSGDIKAFDCLVRSLDCSIKGEGDVKIAVYEKLNVSIFGSGDLQYKGHPDSVTTNIQGAGDVKRVD